MKYRDVHIYNQNLQVLEISDCSFVNLVVEVSSLKRFAFAGGQISNSIQFVGCNALQVMKFQWKFVTD